MDAGKYHEKCPTRSLTPLQQQFPYFCRKYSRFILQLDSFILTNFKNYSFQQIDCSPGLTCFIGRNGMGKTNLLDAIYYLCMGKSYFNLPDSLVANHDSDFFRLEGHFLREGRKEEVVAKVMPRRKKALERNGVPYNRLSEHVGLFPVVMIAPDDTNLATEGSEIRRRFLDNTLSQLDNQYLQHLIRYNKLLQQRNALLKKFGEEGRYNPTLLETYSRQMAGPATAIYQSRRDFMEPFREVLRRLYQSISGEAEEVDCRYTSKMEQGPLEVLMQEAAEKDRILQRTTAGPHKDDLDFTIRGYPLKRFASQGQLKSFILSLKLAQYRLLAEQKKMPPLLLLDDIFDKLDGERATHLLELLLQEDFGQAFITDTDEQRLEAIIQKFGHRYLKYSIEGGRASKMSSHE
ncbi:MAG: DNA replication/repair protein RecF [Lewinellaceae bacterium]|nr:DNA replication/repair protein RecF [Lewinellaceae bacterium]